MSERGALRGTPDGDDLVTLSSVRFSYPNGLKVLDGVDVTVPRGSIVGIVGPSGCGKSTILRLIAGLLTPTGGTLQRRHGTGRERHPLAMVFQQSTLLPWLTAQENVGLCFRIGSAHRLPREEQKKLIARLLDLVGLSEFAGSYPYQLSGGMQRRIAFLASVAPMPELLLLDEPFSSVDEPTRVGIHQDILKIIHDFHITVILVTHDLAEAASLCDEVLIMSQRPGRIAHRHMVPFGPARTMLDLRHSPAFLELYGTLWADLSKQMTATS
jgi:ABC-type nitrate/sulfonate/bicarbonate transport system ATPase subunit